MAPPVWRNSKRWNKWQYSVLLVLALSSLLPAQAKTIRVVSGAWGEMTQVDGKGLYIQVVREALADTGVELNVRVTNWKRAKQMFYANRADLLLVDHFDNNSRQFYSRWHLDMDPPVVMFSLSPLGERSALQGKTVGWMLGYEFGRYLPVAVNGIEVSEEQFGFDLLEYGRLDAYISYEDKVPAALTATLQRLQLAPAQPLYPVFQNTFAGRQLAADFDRGMARLYHSGRLEKIYAEYFQRARFPALQR